MLLTKMNTVRELVTKTGELRRSKALADRVNTFHRFAENEIAPMRRTIKSIRDVHREFPGKFPRYDVDTPLMLLQQTVAQLEQIPSKELSGAVDSMKQIDAKARVDWQTFAANYHRDVLNMIRALRKVLKQEQELVQLGAALEKYENVWPISESQITAYKLKVEEARAKISSLQAGEAVIRFLEKMSAGRATLDDLNDEAMQWMKAKNLSGHIGLNWI